MSSAVENLAEVSLTCADGRRSFFMRPQSAGDQGVVRQVFVEHQYEPGDGPHARALEMAAAAMRADGTVPLVFDLGANIGATAVFFAIRYPGSRVLAVEPHPANAALLRRNTAGLDVTCLPVAAGGRDGEVSLLDPGMGDWGYRTGPPVPAAATPGPGGALVVPCRTPAGLLAGLPADVRPLVCKIDVEGAESELFGDDAPWARRFPLIVIELHDWMLPARRSSRPFLRWLATVDAEVCCRGENLFCFNLELLGAWL